MSTSDYFDSRLARELHRLSGLSEEERMRELSRLQEAEPEFHGEIVEMLRAAARMETTVRREWGEGDVLGPYTLVEFLGEGGFGQVWRASRDGMPDVAVKIARFSGRHSEEFMDRFQREWMALGRLDHVGVATIRDHGLEPEPYLAMELVSGPSVTAYLNARSVPLGEKISLAAQLCEAVQHAHGKSVLHRDLKPSNVLVVEHDGRPQVKVIDFGIARLVDETALEGVTALTRDGDVRGTLAYMSPEQAGWSADGGRPDVDVRTDVFGIGRILFEMLTGTKALEVDTKSAAGYGQALGALTAAEPPSPRERLGSVPVDLDAIVRKATARNQGERYSSVEALLQDLRRWERDEPVSAQPPGARDRLRRAIRRHRAVLVPALVGLGVLGALALVAERGRRREAHQRARAESMLSAQTEHLATLDVRAMGEVLRNELMDHAGRRTDAETAAALVESVDAVSLARSFFETSYLGEAEAAYRSALGENPEMLASLLATVTRTRRELGIVSAAIPTARETLRLREQTLGLDHEETAKSIHDLAALLRLGGEFDEAHELHVRAQGAWKRIEGSGSAGALSAQAGQGLVAYSRGDFDRARSILEVTVAQIDLLDHPLDLKMILPWSMLAACYQAVGRHREAVDAYSAARDRMVENGGASALDLAQLDVNLGQALANIAYGQGGDPEEIARAEAVLAPATEIVLAARGDDHPVGMSALNARTMLARLKGDPEAMLASSARVLAAMGINYGKTDPRTLRAQANHVMGLVDAGHYEEGAALALSTIEAAEATEQPEALLVALMVGERGRALLHQARFREAEPLLLQAYESVEALGGRAGAQAVGMRAQLRDFYGSWHAAEPDLGKDQAAAAWAE